MKSPRSFNSSISLLAKQMVLREIKYPEDSLNGVFHSSAAVKIGSVVFGKKEMDTFDKFRTKADYWRKKLGVRS